MVEENYVDLYAERKMSADPIRDLIELRVELGQQESRAQQMLEQCICDELPSTVEASWWQKMGLLIKGLYYMSPLGKWICPTKHKLAQLLLEELRRRES